MRFLINRQATLEQMEEELNKEYGRISIDVETVSLANRTPLGIAIAVSPDLGFYFFNPKDEFIAKLVQGAEVIILHNAKFDLPILRGLGYNVSNYEDTKMLAYAAGFLDNSLEELSRTLLMRNCPSVKTLWRRKERGNLGINHVKLGGMSIIHACNTFALWDALPKTPLYYDLDKPCIELVIEMESWGVKVDQYALTKVEQAAASRAEELEAELYEVMGKVNLASNPQVTQALQQIGVIGTRKTKGGKDSVSDESLKPLNHPIADKLLRWRKEVKTLSTYVPAFRNVDAQGRVHTNYNYTTTGRFRSGDKEGDADG